VLLLAVAALGEPGLELVRTRVVRAPFPVSAYRVLDVDGDGRDDLLIVGVDGEVRTFVTDAATGRLDPRPRGSLVLPEPHHTLLAVADFLGDGRPPQLVALSRGGTRLYLPLGDAAFAPEGIMLASRARFRLRTGEPVFADVVQDINGDGRPDLVVPGRRESEVWISRKQDGASNGTGGPPRLRRAARIAIDIRRDRRMRAGSLSDRLWTSFSVPRLRTRDVNGDGRRDLIAQSGRVRGFHIQREDSTIPAKPDVVLDLHIFRDTSPAATIRPGRTLVGGDKARFQSRDLDGDKIPDYVIAHRRKVWVFHGNRKQPQFTEPTTILKVSDDITALLLTNLDDDAYPDLLLFKLQVPTVATLIVGAVKSFKVEFDTLGYASEKGRSFSRSPKWRSRITVRVPAILKILKNPGALVSRFEEVGRKFRPVFQADLDGDGAKETIMANADATQIDVWSGNANADKSKLEGLDHMMRRLLFEEDDKEWDIDRILRFFNSLAERRATRLTGGRDPDTSLKLRPQPAFRFVDVAVGDLDGNGKAEMVVRYLPADGGPSIFDIVALKN